MSAQTRYSYTNPIGAPGGIVDLAPYAIDTYINEEATGTMKFGLGVVAGSTPGSNAKIPTDGSKATDFLGIVTNSRSAEYDLEGKINLRNGVALGVMRYGRVYGRVANGVTPAFGDKVYMISSGDEAGCFTNAAGSAIAIAIAGVFRGTVDDTTKVAQIELFNQAQSDS